ncbi:hypothetical protein EsH8_VI_000421 [Colletotrichum jinshuiense]
MSQAQPVAEAARNDPDGYELQIALDQLAAGSTEALRLFLARKNGVDPETASIRKTPWEMKPDDINQPQMRFVGKLDNLKAPDDPDPTQSDEAHTSPYVMFEDTGIAFDYSPLDPELRQFRLLKLAPPDENGVTRQFQLETFCLDDAPSYLCLSYVWGDPRRFLGINCNSQMISVTQNLYHALRTCFNRHPNSWLWADGICINQDDVIERSQQVLLMGKIYQRAALVLAHPGHFRYSRADDEADTQTGTLEDRLGGLGVQDMLSFGAESPVEQEVSQGLNQPYGLCEFSLGPVDDAYDPKNVQGAISIMTFLTRIWQDRNREKIQSDKEWDQIDLPNPNTEGGRETWNNLVQFWSTDWYFRTWVLQEVILAAKVVVLYGQTAISLEAVTDFWDLAKQRGLPRVLRIGPYADMFNMMMHLSPVSSFKMLRDRRVKKDNMSDDEDENSSDDDTNNEDKLERDVSPSMPSLFELLCLTRKNLATDPRDKVYGLLGLTDDAIAQSIVPDYSSGNSPSKVFCEVAAQMVGSGLTTDLLHHSGIDHDIPDLPSWVPDWTIQSRSTLPVHLYQCMPGTSPRVSVQSTNEKAKLVISGAILAQINLGGPAWRYYTNDNSLLPFHDFKNKPEIEFPPFNDEDSRNVILTFASLTTADMSVDEHYYGEEGFQDALMRTLVVDRSWQGERIGQRTTKNDGGAISSSEASEVEQSNTSVSEEFFAGVDAFKRFYARGPDSEEDERAPGIRVHQTAIFKWLLDFDEEVEADLQKRMIPYTIPFQEAQRGRRFATMGTRGPKAEKDDPQATGTSKESEKHSEKSLKNHFIGTVPWNADVGDYVVLLEGFRTPFVLRKCQEDTSSKEPETFEIVGDCYVHGAMDGELMCWKDDIEEELKAEQVRLNNDGREYAVKTPQGYVSFQNFIIS